MMLRAYLGRLLASCAIAAFVLAPGVPALAQSTGMVKGLVVDADEKPVDGARIAIEYLDGVTRKFEVKSNRRGEFIQIGLQPGNYRVTATKEGVGTQSFEVRVRIAQTAEVKFQLSPTAPSGAPMTKEEIEYRRLFEEGVKASGAGEHDLAIERFTGAMAIFPDCYACQYNIGGSYAQKQDWANAEAAFKKAIEMKPDTPEPYNALANIYNTQKKFDMAAAMTEEATKRSAGGAGGAGGGSADDLFNQGVIFWNAGKIAEAKRQFEAAVQANPKMADAHYWAAMAYLNEGNLDGAGKHFEEYVTIAPTGQYAEQAKSFLAQLKK
jgi:tetratricopeptide (TPR) repeat protein